MNASGGPLIAGGDLVTSEVSLRPIRQGDAQSDYEAVMETRGFLREWEGTGWPEEDFTVEANREDLIRLERRHQIGESFTYTVVSPEGARCLGCVYIFPTGAPLFAKAQVSAKSGDDWLSFQAAVYFWVRQSAMAEELDRRLVGALDLWLRRDWGIERHLYVTNERVPHQRSLLEDAGRRPLFELRFSNRQSAELAFA